MVTEDISKGGIVKYIMETNLHWNDKIFHTVDWDGMWACMDKLSDLRVTHVIKLVHGWQNYEQQTNKFTRIMMTTNFQQGVDTVKI